MSKKSEQNDFNNNEFIKFIGETLLEKQAEKIIVLDVQKLTTVTDFVFICTSTSTTQSKAIADHARKMLKDENILPLSIEGYENLNWVLMDYANIVIHIFLPEYREFYDLERLWGDAESILIEDSIKNEK